MPQNLTTTRGSAAQALQVGGRTLATAHEQIAGILRSRLGQNHAELLAVPKTDADGGIAWSTHLAGTATPAAQLPADERARLQQRAERFLSEIRGLAQQLRGEGPASVLVAQMLEQAAQQPPGEWLYSVGGRPVLVMWGHAAAAAQAPVAVAAAAAPPAVPAPPLPPMPPTPAASARPWKRWWLWGLLALLLLALLFWGWKRCSTMPVADAALDEQIAQAETRNKTLEDELPARRGAQPQMQCVPDAPPRAASAAAPPAPEQRAEAPAPQHCPGERPPAAVPEFVIVFDASPSMAYSLNASKAQIDLAEAQDEQAEAMRALGLLRGPTPLERLMVEPHRMTPARAAAVSVAERVPADMGIGLVMVDSCAHSARSVGMFAPGRRAALLARLRGLRPAAFSDTSGTPLADGIAKAGRMVDGVHRDATLLVVSDGEESCKGDPCAVAAALARAKPRLRINVLDITGTGAGNCVAAATKGRVFTARNAAEIAARMRQAAQDAMAPADCKP